MIRHLAELSALFLCFAVGVGLLAAFGIGLLLIWGKRPAENSTLEDEYRRVENDGSGGGRPLSRASGSDPTCDAPWVGAARTFRPYNWATREPMVWTFNKL